jgi:hypothetical protein
VGTVAQLEEGRAAVENRAGREGEGGVDMRKMKREKGLEEGAKRGGGTGCHSN